jgi:hypothetical protein
VYSLCSVGLNTINKVEFHCIVLQPYTVCHIKKQVTFTEHRGQIVICYNIDFLHTRISNVETN